MNYQDAYKNLNTAQKKAVDTLEGPVMVVAGPGTGKTQVLALRIAHILQNTDTPASGILCLTFTRSGVLAMQSRLEEYIGQTAREVTINTFHGFALSLIEKHYAILGFHTLPKLVEETDTVLLFDEILENYEWKHIRPRSNPSLYFGDMSSLISLLKRERVSPENFLDITKKEIEFIKNDPSSLSSRGPRKGELKKEVQTHIEGLERTIEVIRFYEIYEGLKKDRALMDYDDVLSHAVELAAIAEDVRSELREDFLYILIDEHQDSSAVQNSFLKTVWADTEKPNIFIVGDDRQLIYGFSGASFDYFTEFKHMFGKAELITLTQNYRSTQNILSLGDELLKSSLSKETLQSSKTETGHISLCEYTYPRDEILACGLYFKEKIEQGVKPQECALLLPKNYQVRNATEILKSLNVPVTSTNTLSLFASRYFLTFKNILQLVNDPLNPIHISDSVLDPFFSIPVIKAHLFLKEHKAQDLQITDLKDESKGTGLFGEQSEIALLGNTLEELINKSSGQKVSYIVSFLGNELFINTSKNYQDLITRVEMVRTCIHLSLAWEERHPHDTLSDFINYLLRVESYGHNLPIAALDINEGIQVMTLHKSKGLEYEHVWIAHMNEEVVMSEKRAGFTLPEEIKNRLQEKNIESVKKELYVALTRAKTHVTFSYSASDYRGLPYTLSSILQDLKSLYQNRISKEDTVKNLLLHGPEIFTQKPTIDSNITGTEELKNFVKDHFTQTKISVSMLNNFFECPWKWYFRNFLRLPELKSVSLALGSSVHSVLEYILKEENLPNISTIEERLSSELKKEGVYEKKEHQRLLKDGLAILLTWINEYYKNISKNRISERSLSFRDPVFPTLLMYGKIDLTEILPNGDIIVTDFKTGAEKTKGVIEKLDDEHRLSSYMRQLAMYAYLFRHVEKKDVSEIRLLFLEADTDSKNKVYSTHISQEVLDMLLKDITDYNESLLDGTWIDRKCYHKSYGKERSECEYCLRAKNIFGV